MIKIKQLLIGKFSILATGMALFAISLPSMAVPLLQSATVSLYSPALSGLGLTDPITDSNVAVGAGPEIAPGTTGNIGKNNLLLPGEYIDLGQTSIILSIANGGSGFSTGWPAGTYIQFTNLIWTIPADLAGVGVIESGMTGATLGTTVTFNNNSMTVELNPLSIDSNGVPADGDLGLLTLNLTATATPSSVPEPASLALFGVGLSGLLAMRRRRHAG